MKSYKKHLIIVGSARSGTSWFSELIARQHRYRMLFEPEHEFNTQEGKLICDRYLSEAISNKSINGYLKRVFANRVDNDWIAQISNRKWKRHLWPFIPKKFIIKFVRCNLAANYFAEAYTIPVIFIVRNPYDVLASQQRVQFPWLYDISWFQSQDKLCNIIQENYDIDIRMKKEVSNLEKLCLRWCIENTIPFLQKGNPSIKRYKYEDIKADMNLFLKICKDYNIKPLQNLQHLYTQPSSKTHPKSKIVTGKDTVKPFSKEEYTTINRYLDIFKIDYYKRVK